VHPGSGGANNAAVREGSEANFSVAAGYAGVLRTTVRQRSISFAG
jgi:hypothetical protein